jgi:hypothetical protein
MIETKGKYEYSLSNFADVASYPRKEFIVMSDDSCISAVSSVVNPKVQCFSLL